MSIHPLARPPSYRALLVYAGWSPAAQKLVQCAATLAHRFGARLIGVTTPALIQTAPGPGFAEEQGSLERDVSAGLQAVGKHFVETTGAHVADVAWKCRRTSVVDALHREAHAADLCVVSPSYTWPRGSVWPAQFEPVLHIGRPVLVAPPGVDRVDSGRVAVLWNESPQCQRALADALPFLFRAHEVTLVHFCEASCASGAGRRLEEVVEGLAERGVAAGAHVQPWRKDKVAKLVNDFVADHGTDLLVAGAHGHSRLYRALLGSTTDELIRGLAAPILFSR